MMIKELLFNSKINDNSKDSKGIENFLLKKKRVSELNKISKELSSNKSKGKSGKLSKNSLKSKKGSESFSYNEEYEYNSEITDIVDAEQNDLLEAMFLEAKNSEGQNKIELFLDIIESDETRGRTWSYRSHEEICLIFLESEEHEKFLFYYKKLIEVAHLIEENKMKDYVKSTAEKFVNVIVKKKKESINHWLEDISKDFNILQKDKVINTLEAGINLHFLLRVNECKKNKTKKDSFQEEKINIDFDINVIEYMQDKQRLEELTNEYLIKECCCDPKYLDSKGNTYFYYSQKNNKRGGENYNIPVGWTAFGLEVLKRYGNDDWLANDGRKGEWAVAYHGFGGRMRGAELKSLIKTIVHDNLRPGSGQACEYNKD